VADVKLSDLATIFSVLAGLSARSLFAQCPDGTPLPCAAPRAAPARYSVAVLTFENVTRDTSAQYLAEGLADQISTRLGGVERLVMVSRTAVRRLRNAEQLSVPEIGRQLNTANLVSGTIQMAGGRVRVVVEAVRTATGEAVWSSAFDRASTDLVGIEEAIATEVAAGVAGRLSSSERRALGSRVTASSGAYEWFLRGNVLMARRTRAALERAAAAYRTATTFDPAFADAYGRLAYAEALSAFYLDPSLDAFRPLQDSLLTLARLAAAHAMRLDPRSSDAWMGRALTLNVWSEFDTGAGADDSLLASLTAFRRAVELNPRNDEAWHQYGACLPLVRDSAAVDALRRALSLDPARAITYSDLSLVYFRMGQADRARVTIDTALALEPDGAFRAMRAWYRWAAGDTVGAMSDIRLLSDPEPDLLAQIARDSAAIRVMERRVTHPLWCHDPAAYLLSTSRREQAVQALLRCRPSLWTLLHLRWPGLAPLADDPRIRSLRAESERIRLRARW
jgi:TolB-like protein/cytochrome c-type biogenesis protein CcmH/NrfG